MAKDSSKKPEKSLGEALILAARSHRARAATLLAEVGLHPGQDRALELMASRPEGLAMGELAQALEVKPPTASKMIARLAQQDLVKREGAADDARRVRVVLTEAGRARAAALPELARKLEAELTDGLDAKERKRLRKLLRRAAKSLARANGVVAVEADAAEEEDAAEE